MKRCCYGFACMYTTGWLGRAGCFCWTASIKTFVSTILEMCVLVVVTPQIRMRGSVMHVERRLAVSVLSKQANRQMLNSTSKQWS
jgi:hypothetical protein